MPNNFIGILLTTTPTYTVNTGFSTKLYDAIGNQTIIVQAGASLTMLGTKGNNTIRLTGNKSDWQVFRDGSTAVLVNTDGSRIELPASTEYQTVAFADGNLSLSIDTSTGAAAVVLGSQVLGTTAVGVGSVSSIPGVAPSVDKTPWTLLATSNSGMFGSVLVSDGTAAGTDLKVTMGSTGAYKFLATADRTAAYFFDQSSYYSSFSGSGSSASIVGYSNGTVSGTVVLTTYSGSSSYISTNYVTLVNGKLLLAGDDAQQSSTGKALLLDGPAQTVATTALPYRVPYATAVGNADDAWFTVSTSPYGQELAHLTYAAGQPTVTMVKDIWPGPSSGTYDSQRVQLPNGKLVFLASDGSHGLEPWVSDGSESATVMLKDIVPGANSSSPEQLTAFGELVAFAASSPAIGNSLFTTWTKTLYVSDGTVDGTHAVAGLATGVDPAPTILGQANGLLYFSATTNTNGDRAIYSTNGTSATLMAAAPQSLQWLGMSDRYGFFKGSDTAHGLELWVADWSAGTIGLVKDVLPGSGSGLNWMFASPMMVGDKLVFPGYVSATQLGLWASDGTSAGTVNLAASNPLQMLAVGNTLVYITAASEIYAVDLSVATPSPRLLRSDASLEQLQKDADQVFFRSTSNTLYAYTTGAATPVALATQVSQYKVVAENAIFFLQNVLTTGGQALWYSDGTVAGTRFIEDIASGSYDLNNAIAIHTAGIALPPDVVGPVLLSASVNGNALILTYSDDTALDAVHAPAANAFSLIGTTATVSQVSVNASNKTVTLTLSAAVSYGDTIKVSYTDPTSGNDVAAIQDAAGNDAASFSQRVAINKTPDTTAPVFVSGVVNGATVTLTYSDRSSLDSVHPPAASAFTLTGTTATVTGVSVDAASKTVVLTLSAGVDSSNVIKVSYADPTTGNDVAAIQDTAGNDSASLTQVAVVNQTPPKQPWTLFVPSSSGLYASNGTPDGSGWVLQQPLWSYAVDVTSDKAHLVLREYGLSPQSGASEYKVYGFSDASTAPAVLASDVYPGSTVFKAGDKLIIPDGTNSSFNALITDGTLAGTTVLADMPSVVVDAARGVVWSAIPTGPYGSELYQTVLSAGAVSPTLIKDIWSGSASGVANGVLGGVALPNGKLIFTANDGTHGMEPWVSDGSSAGTFMLADFQPGSFDNYIDQISVFNNKAAFSAYATEWISGTGNIYRGRELIFSDGTTAGTYVMDVNVGSGSSNPMVIGQSNNVLYFLARASNSQVNSLFYTDGATFNQLVEANYASILGSNSTQSFFRISDVAHGDELWVLNESTHAISLVKDILVGSGSSLVQDSAKMVGDKLVFSAYISATQQGLFISDGTSAGTTQLSTTLPFGAFGHTLVFSDSNAVYALDTSLPSSSRVSLVTAGAASGAYQSDSDQSFFKLANGDLYATNGTAGGTVKLAESVTNFKVVAENAIYLVHGSSPMLAYSNGTAAGTYDIEAVPASMVSGFDQAVAIHTVGVSP